MKVSGRWLVLAIAASSVAACASATETVATVPPPTTRPPKSTTIPPPPVTFDEMTGAITVYAAASLTETFDEFAEAFAATYPDAFAVVTYDSSAAIAAGVTKGSKIDLFASSDPSQMDQVQTDGLMQAPEVVFATDAFEIVVAPGNPKMIADLAGLSKRSITVGLCEPERPCGRFARRMLKDNGVKLAPADATDAADVLAQVASGAIDAGIVYGSEIAAAGAKVDRIAIPAEINVVAEHSIASVATSKRSALDAAFVELLTGPTGREILRRRGFLTP